jgi:surfeit locus 1 family protein
VSPLLTPRSWGAHLLMVAAVAAAVFLGLWQLHVWEAARADEARDLSKAEPKPLAKVMSGDSPFPGQYLGQPVAFRGEWVADSTLYVQDREVHGKRGYWVVTPVQVGQSAMPVVRGWSPKAEAPTVTGPVAVEGWLQASEGAGADDPDPHDDVIPEMRIASIVEHVDADLYSGYVVDREPTGDLVAVPPDSVPKISASTSLRNLLYAFQWWVFAGFAIYIWVRWCRDVVDADRAELEHAGAG